LKKTLSIILDAHFPYLKDSGNYTPLFACLQETYIPFLQMLENLDFDRVPYRIAIALSPIFCEMMDDDTIIDAFRTFTEKQLVFSENELQREDYSSEQKELAALYLERWKNQQYFFQGHFEGRLLKAFDYFQKQGSLEILCGPATYCFLPFLKDYPDAVRAQIETSLHFYRKVFGLHPQGFWLPEMAWDPFLDPIIHSYGFTWTAVDTHAAALGEPPSFDTSQSLQTPSRNIVLVRNSSLANFPKDFRQHPCFRDNMRDAGFELDIKKLSAFGMGDARKRTGLKYWSREAEDGILLYNHGKAYEEAEVAAASFVNQIQEGADDFVLCCWRTEDFGLRWFEGFHFLEKVFQLIDNSESLDVETPSEYVQHSKPKVQCQPSFSSWGENGYAEPWLDSSNDWIYRHVFHILQEMIEMPERFPHDRGIKERALNQAAREMLLALSSDWPYMMYKQTNADYAKNSLEDIIKNFTTIFESLGSGHISTEWLTNLEKQHNFFSQINYRMFGKKK
jgi:1,4-alpha-glucan branching enzyme